MAQYESFRITGADKLLKRMQELDPKRRVAKLRKYARAAMQPVLRHQQENALQNEGDLVRSIAMSVRTGSRSDRARVLTISVGPMRQIRFARVNQKAIAQEFGTRRQRARPFIRPSLYKNRRLVIANLFRSIRRDWERPQR